MVGGFSPPASHCVLFPRRQMELGSMLIDSRVYGNLFLAISVGGLLARHLLSAIHGPPSEMEACHPIQNLLVLPNTSSSFTDLTSFQTE